jgi:hypothetical protein
LRIADAVSGTYSAAFGGHAAGIVGVAISPDARVGLSGGGDGLVKFYDLNNGGDAGAIAGHPSPVRGVSFGADGRFAISADDAKIRRWEFGLPDQYERFEAELPRAREALTRNPHDAGALATFGRWYELRGMYAWAAEFLQEARDLGQKIPSLDLARCHWGAGRFADAEREFRRAMGDPGSDGDYLKLCLDAVIREKNGVSTQARFGDSTP